LQLGCEETFNQQNKTKFLEQITYPAFKWVCGSSLMSQMFLFKVQKAQEPSSGLHHLLHINKTLYPCPSRGPPEGRI